MKDSDQTGNTRNLRFLVLRGASTLIKDSKNRTPLDLVQDVKSKDIALTLTKLLVRI